MKKRGLGVLFLSLFLVLGSSSLSQAAEPANTYGKPIEIMDGHPIFDNHDMGSIPLYGTPKKKIEDGRCCAADEPKFDRRALNGVAAVDDQQGSNNCWAYSAIAAIECNLIMKGLADNTINLSENHLAYYFYHRGTDKVGYAAGDQNIPLTAKWYLQGGSVYYTARHLQSGSGAVYESAGEDEAIASIYNASDPGAVMAEEAAKAGEFNDSDFYVTDAYFLENDKNTIKEAVKNYGAVVCAYCASSNYYNRATYSSYCPTEMSTTHGVAIVGWDDNFSKENFKTPPQNDGAWIVKNSWGKGWGENGYFYLSYEDKSVGALVAYDAVKTEASYDNNYQYDGTGISMAMCNNKAIMQYANVFTAKENATELLKAVSTEIRTYNVNYKLDIYTGLGETDDPSAGKLVHSQEGAFDRCGYQQIKLTKPVMLQKGERYAVVFTVSTESGEGVYIGLEQASAYSWIEFKSDAGVGQSYLRKGDAWTDYKENGTFRIKAFTDNAELNRVEAVKGKTEYELGDEFTVDDLTVDAIYDDDISREITEYTTNADEIKTDKVGEQKLVITYEEEGITKTAEIPIKVNGLDKIEALKAKTTYKVGETIAVDDLTVIAYYTDNTSKTVTDYTTNVSTLSTATAGEQKLAITYTEKGITKSVEVTLTVEAEVVPPEETPTPPEDDIAKDDKKPVVKPKVKLNATKFPLQIGKSTTALKIVSKTPSNDKVAKWTTSNKKIVTVSRKGKIKAIKKGKATITVTMKSGAKARCTVTVQKGKVTTKKLTLNKKKFTLKKGKSEKLIVARNPISATEKLKWTTSSKKIATVDRNGKVKAKRKGKAKITVKSKNGKKATCTVTVK